MGFDSDMGYIEGHSDADCDDGLFCTGTESCAALNCQPGSGNPCAGLPYYRCDEAADSCVICAEDYDCDGVNDAADNCLRTPNGPDRGSCVKTMANLLMVYNDSCLMDTDCGQETASCMKNQEDSNSDGIGDVCECEADFDADLDVDGQNASQIKARISAGTSSRTGVPRRLLPAMVILTVTGM